MKVLYDHQIFSENLGGVSRYFFEVIRGLKRFEDVKVDIALAYSANKWITQEKKPALNRLFGFVDDYPLRGKTRFRDFLLSFNRANSLRRIREGAYDVFHPTYYDPYFLPELGSRPFVLTIHDLIREVFTFGLSDDSEMRGWMRELARRAAHVITISENTRNDVLRLYGVPESKVTVSYLGNSLNPAVARAPRQHCPDRFVLYVGRRSEYKNFWRFWRAVSGLLKIDPDLWLICIGGWGFTPQEQARLDASGIARRVLQWTVDEETLAYVYIRARCLVFPSLYEGFGLPSSKRLPASAPSQQAGRALCPKLQVTQRCTLIRTTRKILPEL